MPHPSGFGVRSRCQGGTSSSCKICGCGAVARTNISGPWSTLTWGMVDARTASSAAMSTSTWARCMGTAKPFASFPIRPLLMRSRGNQSWQQLSGTLRENRDRGLRIAILAAHPDDETIGASALLARSGDPRVIYLTGGAPRNRNLRSRDFHGSRQEYSSLRRAEAERALSLAGLAVSQIEWLGGVDQEAIGRADHLTYCLAGLFSRIEANVLVTHPYEGGHPDHDTAALV